MKFSILFVSAASLVGFAAAQDLPGPHFLPLHINGGRPFPAVSPTPVVKSSAPCTTLTTMTKPVETGGWQSRWFPPGQDEAPSPTSSWDVDILPVPSDFTPRLPMTTNADFDILPIPSEEPEIWIPTVASDPNARVPPPEWFSSNGISSPWTSKTLVPGSEHTTLQTVRKA